MIRIENLTKTFGPLKAVNNLCLDIPRGQLFGFLGPNGAGKTTTIKMLTGLLKPTSGSMLVSGIDVLAEPLAAKRVMGYVPDMPYLYERLTPEEFMLFIGDLYDVPRKKVHLEIERSFEQFGLMDHRIALVRDLSHGLRQRLIYCATFLHDPEVLFIDEPLIGLDPATIRMIKDLLKAKARGGMTIFLTTHILALAEDIADRIGIILEGSLVALGGIEELRSQAGVAGSLEDVFLSLTESRNGK